MNSIKWLLVTGSVFTASCLYADNPASKEYVDRLIQYLQNQINNIQPGITYTSGTGISIVGNVITNTLPGITYTSGTGISIVGNVITNTQPGLTLHVGDFYQGGVIYWLDPTQSFQHGLISDVTDKGAYQWSSAFTTTGATLSGAYQGQNTGTFNTAKIIATPGATYAAASACATSVSQGFSDWYLPSFMELITMYFAQMTISQTSLAHSGGSLSLNYYWSSTEVDVNHAQFYNFSTGSTELAHLRKDEAFNVRCIRAF